jgi:hypothetical protein
LESILRVETLSFGGEGVEHPGGSLDVLHVARLESPAYGGDSVSGRGISRPQWGQ